MRKIVLVVALATLVFACSKENKTTVTPAPAAAPAPQNAAAVAGGDVKAGSVAETAPSLISFSAGALVVQKPAEYDDGWSAFQMLDERPQTGWATPEHNVTPQTTVVELPERTELDRLEFDTGSIDGDGRGAKDVDIEMSDANATSGFQKIASVSLQDRADRQQFPVSAKVPGRWLRIVVKNNHGSPDYTELMDVRGYGRQLTQTPFPNASGTYETNYGNFHLLQEGTSVSGCYEHNDGLLNGGLSGRVMNFTWSEGKDSRGPATMVFTADGKQMFGLWWYENNTSGSGGYWNGTKISNEVGSCPHWSGKAGAAQAQMAKEIEESGRTRVYGINFDTDSAVIKPESKTKLDEIVGLLKSNAALKLRVEGHTDNTGGEEHNQTLSEQRAQSVKSYLVGAGIDGSRLTTAGMGSSKPVAGNETETGRAQNRRVELAKE